MFQDRRMNLFRVSFKEREVKEVYSKKFKKLYLKRTSKYNNLYNFKVYQQNFY